MQWLWGRGKGLDLGDGRGLNMLEKHTLDVRANVTSEARGARPRLRRLVTELRRELARQFRLFRKRWSA